MKNIFELPDTLDVMKLRESVNESIDDDIAGLIDDSNLTNDERVSKIHDLFMGTSGTSGTNQNNSQNNEIYVPDDVIIMRNGAVDTNSLLRGAHVIDENIGNEIRKELGITPKDPDWGLSSSEDAMIREAFPIIEDIFKKMPQDDKELINTGDTMKNKIEGRIRRSREGIIDWKKALEEFISERSHTYEKGPLRKNVYQRTGIGLKHRVRAYSDFNKCVVYIDTSGSVNNSQTQLIPIMAGEIGKIMQDCHFNTVDIHLFDDVVYNEHFDVDSYTVADEDWGIEGADDGGGTNIHQVYNHIIKNYMENGELRYDINAIIIITDVSGMQSSGNIKPFVTKLGTSVLERMLYVIYNDYNNKYLKEVTEEMNNLVSDLSRHYEISVDNFIKQILQESMSTIKQKRYKINEAVGKIKDIQAKKIATKRTATERSEEEKQERLHKSEIQGARAIGQLDKLMPELFANLEKCFPNCRMVKEYTAVMSQDNTYYVTDDAHVILHMDVDANNIMDLCEACGLMQIDQLVGNVNIRGTRKFSGFPQGFPQEIVGNFCLFNLPMLSGFANAPQAVSGKVSVNVCYPMSRRINKDEQNAYISSIKSTISSLEELENKPKSIFTMTMPSNESFKDIVSKRIMLGEAFLNESLPHKLGAVMPRRSKPQDGSKITDADYIASTALYKKNRDVLFGVIAPILNVPWGDISDDDITVINDVAKIRDAARNTNFFEKNKDNINQLGYAGIRLFTTSNDIISAVYAQTKKGVKPSLIYLTDDDGNPITDNEQIQKEIDWRFDVFQQTYDYLTKLGITPNNIPEKMNGDDANIEATGLHFLYYAMVMLLGSTGKDVEYKFKPSTILADDILSSGNNEQIFGDIVHDALGQIDSSVGSRYYITNAGVRRVSVNFDQTTRHPDRKDNFNTVYLSNPYNRNKTVFRFFNDNFIKAMLIGSSLRGYDELPRYTVEQIVNSDRSELIEMIESVEKVPLKITSLKSMSFEGKSKDASTYNHSNPFDLLMMFPDKCEKEYAIRVDVNAEALSLASKRVTRDIFKSGMPFDIKHMEYDPSTGERYRKDIKGVDTLRREGSKILTSSEAFDSLNGVIDYLLSNKSIFKDIKATVKAAIEDQGWSDTNRVLFRDVNGLIDDISNYSNLVKSAVVNNPSISDTKSDVISIMAKDFEELYDGISTILDEDTSSEDIIKTCSDLVQLTNRIGESYNNLIGGDSRAASVLQKKVSKLGERNRAKQNRQAGQQQVNTTPTKGTVVKGAVADKYEATVDNISDLATKVGDVAESLDFAGASDDAVDYFGTKENMIRRCDTQLNKAIEAMNTIKLGGDLDWMQSTMELVKNVYDLCASIVSASDEELISDSFVELETECRRLVKSAKGFAPSKTYQETGAITA